MDIKTLRERKGMSQAALSKLAGVSQSGICYIETGQKNPSVRTLIKLADALEVSPMEIISSMPILSSGRRI